MTLQTGNEAPGPAVNPSENYALTPPPPKSTSLQTLKPQNLMETPNALKTLQIPTASVAPKRPLSLAARAPGNEQAAPQGRASCAHGGQEAHGARQKTLVSAMMALGLGFTGLRVCRVHLAFTGFRVHRVRDYRVYSV